MSDEKRREHAKEIAKEVQKRRREQQYNVMCAWRDGHGTGIAAIEKIVELEKIIDLHPGDFNPLRTAKPPISTPPGTM